MRFVMSIIMINVFNFVAGSINQVYGLPLTRVNPTEKIITKEIFINTQWSLQI